MLRHGTHLEPRLPLGLDRPRRRLDVGPCPATTTCATTTTGTITTTAITGTGATRAAAPHILVTAAIGTAQGGLAIGPAPSEDEIIVVAAAAIISIILIIPRQRRRRKRGYGDAAQVEVEVGRYPPDRARAAGGDANTSSAIGGITGTGKRRRRGRQRRRRRCGHVGCIPSAEEKRKTRENLKALSRATEHLLIGRSIDPVLN
mmetsp:Transcript_23123/g.48183  ORF Transcript_23123/g.48183 Transcript_23123/m.48183 type:complete len:203 (+) Transcript_23123:1232-1840(+)